MAAQSPIRRYLDNAATSWPKPPEVLAAWEHAGRTIGAAAGRGGYREAVLADGIRGRCRAAVAGLLGGVDQDRVVVCSHASNVTGAVQDAAAIGRLAHDRGGLFLLDAAQTLGQVPCTPEELAADVLVAPGHKWLQGPAGAAILWVRPGLDVDPLVQGGTGSASDSLAMPSGFADAFEAGTPDLPALAGLLAAVEWLASQPLAPVAAATTQPVASGIEAIGRRCRELATMAAAGLAAIDGVRVITPHGTSAPIVSFTVEGYDPAEVAVLLEQLAGVQTRSGFHCAACIHRHVGTQAGGTVRASFGPFNTGDDVDALVEAVGRLRMAAG